MRRAERRAVIGTGPWLPEYLVAWPQFALPHIRQPARTAWSVTAGSWRVVTTSPPWSRRLPHGAFARLLCFYIHAEVRQADTNTIVAGQKLVDWLHEVGAVDRWSARSSRRTAVQLARLASCTSAVTCISKGPNWQQSLYGAADREAEMERGAMEVPSHLRLSPAFKYDLGLRPPALAEADVRSLADDPLALDLCAWLPSWRVWDKCCRFERKPISWAAMAAAFGGGASGDGEKFRIRCALALQRAVERRPKWRVTADADGVRMRRPPARVRCSPAASACGSDAMS